MPLIHCDTGGGDNEVLLDNVTVECRARFSTDWGVDHLTICDSPFKRRAVFERGLDAATLELLAGNFFNKGFDSDYES